MATIKSIGSVNTLSAKTGIGGLVSGMDIDELVFNMTATSRSKITKQQQKIQKLEWKQTAYRSTAKALKEFQSKYLDVLSPTNFRSSGFFNTVKASSSSAAVSVSSTSSSVEGTVIIDSIAQLATKQTARSSVPATKAFSGTLSTTDMTALMADISGKTIGLQLDGSLKTITFDSAFADSLGSEPTEADFAAALQTAVDNAFSIKDVNDRVIDVSVHEGVLSFTAVGSQLSVKAIGGDEEILSNLGLVAEQSNFLSSSKSVKDLGFATALEPLDTFKFTINSVAFEFSADDSLSTIMNRVNSSDANVTLSYSSISDKFTLTSNTTGIGENILIEETEGNLMSAFGLTADAGAEMEYGKNAVLYYNGTKIIRSSNRFQIDGIDIELMSTTEIGADPINITMKSDSGALVEPIKQFVEDYNAMIDLINGLVKEKVYTDYPPLTDEQKEEMTDTQIKNWEEKAKSGLLRGDQALISIASKLHTAIISPIEASGISLNELGITSAGYTENGKLKIDEVKLNKALAEKPFEIRELFASDDGIGTKVNNIITDAIRTTGPKGTRGTLTEIAGIDLTTSDTENNITDTISRTNKTIDSLTTRLTKEETRLWRQFTTMETVLQQLNTQSSIIAQFYTGTGQ
ncbi:MAG: flagellar filament capping protein FliD [Eubacteriales bacterium]|nr:flagellar filament capping protein FliD [Eubacteriales bacterium]MDD3863263.1 flagellar filament capping protein FliD [Eubacteriales bacterium]MDD4445848.1 flagellar filament capping protein FliD [Eubacteriales bacterium]